VPEESLLPSNFSARLQYRVVAYYRVGVEIFRALAASIAPASCRTCEDLLPSPACMWQLFRLNRLEMEKPNVRYLLVLRPTIQLPFLLSSGADSYYLAARPVYCFALFRELVWRVLVPASFYVGAVPLV